MSFNKSINTLIALIGQICHIFNLTPSVLAYLGRGRSIILSAKSKSTACRINFTHCWTLAAASNGHKSCNFTSTNVFLDFAHAQLFLAHGLHKLRLFFGQQCGGSGCIHSLASRIGSGDIGSAICAVKQVARCCHRIVKANSRGINSGELLSQSCTEIVSSLRRCFSFIGGGKRGG